MFWPYHSPVKQMNPVRYLLYVFTVDYILPLQNRRLKDDCTALYKLQRWFFLEHGHWAPPWEKIYSYLITSPAWRINIFKDCTTDDMTARKSDDSPITWLFDINRKEVINLLKLMGPYLEQSQIWKTRSLFHSKICQWQTENFQSCSHCYIPVVASVESKWVRFL